MALPIKGEDVPRYRKVESNWIEFSRLGEFLKELSLTEGRNTGIPTIQRELARNGSPAATFETDEDRLSFLVRIRCHEGEEGVSPVLLSPISSDKEVRNVGVNDSVNTSIDIVKIKNDSVSYENDSVNRENDPQNDRVNTLSPTGIRIFKAIQNNTKITYDELISGLELSLSTVARGIRELKKAGVIARQGSDKTGKWIILK